MDANIPHACWCETLQHFQQKMPDKALGFIKSVLLDGDGEFTIIVNDRGDKLAIQLDTGNYADIGQVTHYSVCYLEHDLTLTSEEGNPGYYMSASQYFPESRMDEAIACFMGRINSPYPNLMHRNESKREEGYTLEQIRSIETGVLFFNNHYDYLDLMVGPTSNALFGEKAEDILSAGDVVAHGDKSRQYNDVWKAAGINHNRGALLYLLTYTPLMNRDKPESCQWVIDNYPLYRPMIERIERNILRERFG